MNFPASFEKVRNANNVDVTSVIKGIDKEGNYTVEVNVIKFKPKTEGGSEIEKKVSVSAQGESLEQAKTLAFEQATFLAGL